ncbi:MAG: murein biosynthesis integral membrane protein MurJ [Gemmatimonadota bacterium]
MSESVSTSRSAISVAGGIFLSRLTGFGRDLAIAHFFGTSLAVDAYTAALRIPNILRNLLGEGTLSAAFVPVYSSFLARGGSGGDARRLARAILGVMLLLAGVLSGLGILLAPALTRIVAPGFGPTESALMTDLVRILFPMSGVMILAAWCLGVLNSHRRFFLPYVAPVVWNGAQIAGLLLAARQAWGPLIYALAWSTLAGSLLQLAVQLPAVGRLAGSFRPALERTWEPARRVTRNMAPVVASQGVFQVSSFLDIVLASMLPTGAIAGLYYAQRVAYLPLALFGVSVATATLPEMSRDTSPDRLRAHLVQGFFRILFWVLPSAILLMLFGDLVIQVLFRHGAFGAESVTLVAWILAAYATGLVASSSVKLFASGFHALQDTATPMRIAAVAIGTGVLVGAGLMFALRARGFGATSAAGLAIGGAVSAWVNLILLWRGLQRRIGRMWSGRATRTVGRLVLGGLAAAAVGWVARAGLSAALGGEAAWRGPLVLLGTLALGSVPYLLIARRPPTIAAAG